MIVDRDTESPYYVTVFEEENEHFINIQKVSRNYNFCPEMDFGKYRIPMVALPILKNAACKIRYPLKYTPALKQHLEKFTKERIILEQAKNEIQDPSLRKDIEETVVLNNGFHLAETQIITLAFALLGKTILIGNEIGDGKTLTANALAHYLLNKSRIKKIVVITAASLVENYLEDYKKFFGDRDIVTTSGMGKDDRVHVYKIFATPDNGIRFLVTNYEKCALDFDYLKKCKPDLVIVDEFHKIRNFISAQRSQKFFELIQIWRPEFRIPMTGTPIENKLFDLYPVFKFLNDGDLLGSQEFFERNFVEFEEIFFKVKPKRGGREFVKRTVKAVGFKNHEYLKDIIRHLVIRKRTKLPVDKYEHFEMFDMPEKILEGYKTLGAQWHPSRQFLNNPMRLEITLNPKLDRLLEILDQTSEKTVVFSFYKDTIRMLSEKLSEKGIKHHIITGDVKKPATEVINEFKVDSESKVLLCTDKVEHGVNIQFARNVVNFEMPLKPTTYKQRYGRVYRRGQTHDVQIYNFIYEKCIESDIYDMVKRKKDIIDKVFESLDSCDDKKMAEIDRDFLNAMMMKYKINLSGNEMEM